MDWLARDRRRELGSRGERRSGACDGCGGEVRELHELGGRHLCLWCLVRVAPDGHVAWVTLSDGVADEAW